jgi:FAD dependent oxidoreductase TIGR03364
MRVVIAGGGILGLMHAREAVRRGHSVLHLEREAGTRGASVRNFGLIWVSGRSTAELPLALRARSLWQDVPGAGFRANGSLTVLRGAAEVAAASAAERDDFRLLTPSEARKVNPALRGKFDAAVHCGLDAAVESRLVPAALRAAMGDRYEWLPGREVRSYFETGVEDHTGARHEADLVVLCTGAAHTGVAHVPGAALRRVRIQMMQTAPLDEPVTTSIADGDSMRYYPAWRTPLLDRLEPQAPVAEEGKMQLLLVQRLDGSLTIGDTHEYAEPFPFDVDERYYGHLRAVSEELLGRALPPIVKRWAGVYSQTTDDTLYHRSSPCPGVVIVTGPGGRGMTMSPAIAEETFL